MLDPLTTSIFRRAGLFSLAQLRSYDFEDTRLTEACNEARNALGFPDTYAKALLSRCISAIYRTKSASAAPVPPEHFVCPSL
jgi:hypothetical protein